VDLFVSLPSNARELALAAANAGADALKLHMNVVHEASGTHFGSFAQESGRVRDILAAVSCPVGLMPGADFASLPTREELLSLGGLQFIDIYSHHMPIWFLDLPYRLILALREFDGLVEPPFFASHFYWPPEAHKNRINMVEASIFGPQDLGQPFTYADYRRLRILQEYVDAPLLVPTQKNITPEDAQWLKRTGTAALMIGKVVTGDSAESIARATEAYRKAIDAID
jgi:hypothetical protein